MIYDYRSIKAMARQTGGRVADFLVLASINDPFYVGQEAQVSQAKWFADIWDSGILEGRSHIRGIHYFLISREDKIPMPNGMPFENTDQCWAFLGTAVKAARYLELVDPRVFKDRRNPPPQIFTAEATTPLIHVVNEFSSGLELPDFPALPHYHVNDFTGTQEYMTEIWIEKSTMEDELIPLCEQYECNLVTGVGELSITQCIALIDRIIAFERPCRILYISDFDPAGRSMPLAVARKIEFYQRNQYPDLDIQLQQIALTYDQCQKYRLPRTPIKEKEKRAGKFEELYGKGATELDALEALYPGELTKIVEEEVGRFYDKRLAGRCAIAAYSLRDELDNRRDEIAQQYENQIAVLRNKYEDIRARFEAEVQGIAEQVEEVWHAIREEMMEDAPEEVDVPVAQIDDDMAWDDPLYDSERSYEEQLESYQKFKTNGAID